MLGTGKMMPWVERLDGWEVLDVGEMLASSQIGFGTRDYLVNGVPWLKLVGESMKPSLRIFGTPGRQRVTANNWNRVTSQQMYVPAILSICRQLHRNFQIVRDEELGRRWLCISSYPIDSGTGDKR